MTLAALVAPFPTARYSKRLANKITAPRYFGCFNQDDATMRGMRLAEGSQGRIEEGNCVRLYFLVDPENGVILDCRFQVYGQSALIGAAEAACELVLGKNYDQAMRIGTDLIDKELRDRSDRPAFPIETFPHINLVIGAIHAAGEECEGIPLAETYVAPPAPPSFGEVLEGGYPGFDELPLTKKIAVIEQALDADVRPYIALDGGGVEVSELNNNRELIVNYQGNCTSCFSSTGATLSYIQQVLRAKVHPELVVIPKL